MRHRLQLALFVSLFVPLLGFAAVFDTDDFDDGIRDPIKWILPDKLSGGFLSETNSHLEFSCSSFGGDASATWASGLPTASNWVISLDVAIAVPMRGPELVRWEVLVSPPGIPYQKHFTVGFQQTGPELSDHSCTYEAFANGVLATKGSTNVSDFQGTLRLRYAAADNLIFAEYRTPGTTNFSLLAMYSTVGWDLHTIPVLTATLHASSISLPVTSGSMYVDNFAVSTPQQMPTSAPQIIARPRSRPAVVGNSVEFQVAASGYPLAYQWSFNGQAITDATNSVLRLSNVTTNKSGLYSVAISNALDTVSSTAQLTVYRSFSVALYGDADFVDYSSYYPISFPPDLFGVLTQPFTRSIADAITNQAIIFPCLRRDPSTWLGWTNALQSFVRQGGIMITTGSGAAEMLNRVFGFSLVALDGPGVFARTAQAQGTIFEFGPEYLPNDVDEREAPPHCRSALISASLPLGARDLYHQDASAQSVVAFMPFGSGGVVYMGWDTYNSAPFGLGDRGWFETMGNALSLRGGLPLTAPIITAQPRSQERLALEDVTFVVSANGSVPIRAQWFFENKLISGATNNALNLQSVAMNQTGNYFAVISNAYGSVTSQVAHLEVRPTRGVVGILQQAYATSLAAFIEGAGFTPVVFSSITNCDLSRLDMLMIDSFSFNEGVELKRRLPEIRKWIIHGGKLISHQWSEILPESVVLSPSTGLGLGIVPPGDNLVVNGPHGMLDLIPLDGTFRHDGAALSQSLPARALPILNDGSETNIVAFSYSIGLGSVFYSSLEFLSYAEGPGKVQEILRNVYLPNLLEHAASFSVSGAPVVVQQSSDTTAFLSTGVSLYVGANGQMPLSYQWLHDGIMVANATNAFLYLTNLSLAHAGSYTVLLSNSFDVVASHSLILNPIPQPLLRIAALTGNLPQALDPVSLIGRGRGGIAVSSSNIFYTGEIGTGRFPISFAGIRANIGLPYCSFVSDLRTEKVYLLLDQSNLLVSTGHLTALNEINPDGSFTTNRVELSTPIKLGYDTTIFAGLEGPVLATDNKVYRIALPSGAVMDLGVIPSLGRTTCAWCSWGVAETYSNSVYLVYVRDSQTVVRTHVPSGVTTVLSSFANLGDVCAFTVSPKLGRWYFHSAGASQFAGGESIVAASASFDQPPRITGTLTNRTILEDSATGPIPFFMNDAESPANQIVGTVAAANSLLIPKTNIVVSGSTLLARTVSITPGRDQFGTSVVTVTVTDAIGQTTNASFILTVLPVNDPPSFDKGADISVLEDCGPRAFAAWASHIRAGPLNESDQGVSFQVSSDNSLLFSSPPVITPNGTLLFEPAPNANGIAHVTVQLHDDGGTANGGSDTSVAQTFNITIAAVNDPPLGVSQSVSVSEDTSLEITLSGLDVEADALTFSIVTFPSHGILTGSGAGRRYEPATNFFGADSFSFKVNDGQSDSPEAFVSIQVTPVNDVPEAAMTISPALFLTPDSTNAVAIAFKSRTAMLVFDGRKSIDVDNDPLSYSWYVPSNSTSFASGPIVTNSFPVGLFSVMLVVDDGQTTASTNAIVEIIAPPEAVRRLNLFLQGSAIQQSTKQQLGGMLKDAVESFNDQEFRGGVRVLQAFQKQVLSKISDSELAGVLVTAAQKIIDSQAIDLRLTTGRKSDQGDLEFTLIGEPSVTYTIEASENLRTWIKVMEVSSSTGTNIISIKSALNMRQQFYRASTSD